MTELDIPTLYRRYADTFSTRQVDAIVALHAGDTVFQQHTGHPPATGPAGVRAAFGALFTRWPDLTFEERRTLFGDRFWILDWTLVADTGRTRLNCLDVVTLDPTGLVLRKDTYLSAPPR
jgi:ketosteroid isomerase-like protein